MSKTGVYKIENVKLNWVQEKSDPNATFEGKPAPKGRFVEVNLGLRNSEMHKKVNTLFEKISNDIVEKYEEIGKYDIAVQKDCLKLKALDGKPHAMLRFNITKFKGDEEVLVSEPTVVFNGEVIEKMPYGGAIVDIEYDIKNPPPMYSNKVYITPLIKTIIVKEFNNTFETSGGDSNSNNIKFDVKYDVEETSVKEPKKATPQPKPKAKPQVEEEDDGVVTEEDIGLAM